MNIQPGIGYVFDSSEKGFTFDTSEQFPDHPSAGLGGNLHPFKVISLGPSGSNFRFRVIPGTLNNVVPVLFDVISSQNQMLDRTTSGVSDPPIGELSINTSTLESWIYLRAGKSSSTNAFPDDDPLNVEYPLVMSSNLALSDTDTYGYVLIAKYIMDSATAPTTGTLSQYVTGSLWGDRLKLGTLTAKYYYARI